MAKRRRTFVGRPFSLVQRMAAGILLFRFHQLVFLEEKRNTPKRGERDNDVDDSADYARRAAENPCHEVKAEKTDQTPVQTADEQYEQCDFIHHFDIYHSFQNICEKTRLLFSLFYY